MNRWIAPFFSRLWIKLLLAYLVPVAIVAGGMGFLAYRFSRITLEEQLGESLASLARVAASSVGRPWALRLEPGDEQSRTYGNLKLKLVELKASSRVEAIYLFDSDGKAIVDSDGTWRIGEEIVKLAADRSELAEVFQGRSATSTLFMGKDGRYYKTGFAPVFVDQQVVAAVGVDGSARFFDPLAQLGRTFGWVIVVTLSLVVLITLLVSRGITRPVARLAEGAAAIGRGEFDREMAVETEDEIGLLAQTLNDMRRSIQRRDQNLQMMLSGIAHEVRNPLAGMTLFVGLLKEELGQNQTALGHLVRIDKELTSLGKIVNDFLDFARKRQLDLEVVDPAEELAQIQGLVMFDFAQANVALCVEVEPTLEKVVWDRERMRGVMLNLLRNAVQASAAGTRVTLSLGRQGEEWVLAVRDEGCGIEPDIQEKVFEPFFTTRQQGTGLGLALVRKIVEAHAGRIVLASAPGKGAVISVHLPVRER